MQVVSSSEARNNLSAMLSAAKSEPITIQKQGHNEAVLISYEEYERLSNASIFAFQTICNNIGEKAQARGLTEEKLAEILAEDD